MKTQSERERFFFFAIHSSHPLHSPSRFAEAFARIECHYFKNEAFFERDGWLLEPENLDKLRSIPTTIVQGRYDIVCPFDSAWQLHKGLPHADFVVLPNAGHSARETPISRALVAASDKYSYIGTVE